MSWISPITLENDVVRLAPMSREHADDLASASADGALSELWYTTVPAPADIPADIERKLKAQADGAMAPFTAIDPSSGRAVGMTTYMNIDAVNKRLEIGSTWYAGAYQRTALNTNAKYLLLSHAFGPLGCNAVELRTHFMNLQSRRAIERLGAKLDGVLRNHMIMPNGTLRDTCVYSILANEWPAVAANLEHRMRRR